MEKLNSSRNFIISNNLCVVALDFMKCVILMVIMMLMWCILLVLVKFMCYDSMCLKNSPTSGYVLDFLVKLLGIGCDNRLNNWKCRYICLESN